MFDILENQMYILLASNVNICHYSCSKNTCYTSSKIFWMQLKLKKRNVSCLSIFNRHLIIITFMLLFKIICKLR